MQLADRVRETSLTEGTIAFVLEGAEVGYRAFGDVLADGETTLYGAALGAQSEVGEGMYDISGNSLIRLRVFSSSNNGELVDFGAGAKKIWIDHPAFLDMAAAGLAIVYSQRLGVLA